MVQWGCTVTPVAYIGTRSQDNGSVGSHSNTCSLYRHQDCPAICRAAGVRTTVQWGCTVAPVAYIGTRIALQFVVLQE